MLDFSKVVSDSWVAPSPHHEPCIRLFFKMQSLGKTLRKWSKPLYSDLKLEMYMSLEVILWFDMVQDFRQLSPEERDIRSNFTACG
jgi:hypothetical protein